MEQQRPSAALVMGILSGGLAALTILPTAIPLTSRLHQAEEHLALQYAMSAANVADWEMRESTDKLPFLQRHLQLRHLSVTDKQGNIKKRAGVALPAAMLDVCEEPTGTRAATIGNVNWSVACVRSENGMTIAAWTPNYDPAQQVGYLVITLAAIVGIITALGVLRILAPLSKVTQALTLVGKGERGIRMNTFGIAEVDELVARLNMAASAMEAREDAITARIEVVQQMARLVAHEIRNPLQSLELLTSLIATETSLHERKAIARSIQAEIRALDNVGDRILREGSSSGAVRLHRTMTSLRPIVDHVLTIQKPKAGKRGVQLIQGHISEHAVFVDEPLLERSLENLVINALQAVEDRRGVVQVSVVHQADHLSIQIDDNGPGGDHGLGGSIFNVNVTTKSDGTGLGLALVKGVMEAHGGTISHTVSTMGGARFIAKIPLRDNPEESSELDATT
jgi:signal transduction histidine kinase